MQARIALDFRSALSQVWHAVNAQALAWAVQMGGVGCVGMTTARNVLWCSVDVWVCTESPMATDVMEVEVLSRLMLTFIMALAQAGTAFPWPAALHNSPTLLVLRSCAFNHRSPVVTWMYWRHLIYILTNKFKSIRGFSKGLALVCTVILLEEVSSIPQDPAWTRHLSQQAI